MSASSDATILVLGRESAGKTQLIASLTGKCGNPMNVRGSTIACEHYVAGDRHWIDTPGLYFDDDTVSARSTLSELGAADRVLLVVQGTHIDDDLDTLLPLVTRLHKRACVVVTFWDKVRRRGHPRKSLVAVGKNIGLPMIPVDARKLRNTERRQILSAVDHAKHVREAQIKVRAGWRIDAPRTVLERKVLGPIFGALAMLVPIVACVWLANGLANRIDPVVTSWLAPLALAGDRLPGPLADVLSGDYGLITMGPLLFVWALPTVMLVGLLIALGKASGVLDRIAMAVHPATRHFGISGRDVVRVAMGYGCNVPAVVSTRACSNCTRASCVSAIAFGSACSYQLAATLAVFAAVGKPWLVAYYIVYLNASMLIYNRLTSPAAVAAMRDVPFGNHRIFLCWPRWKAVKLEMRSLLLAFLLKATPIFIVIAVIASVLSWLGVVPALARMLEPIMAIFNLPAATAMPVVLASIRKDGILLFATSGQAEALSAAQVLTGVYLASVALPCLVTAYTIARELNFGLAVRMIARQLTAAVLFSVALAWGAALLVAIWA